MPEVSINIKSASKTFLSFPFKVVFHKKLPCLRQQEKVFTFLSTPLPP